MKYEREFLAACASDVAHVEDVEVAGPPMATMMVSSLFLAFLVSGGATGFTALPVACAALAGCGGFVATMAAHALRHRHRYTERAARQRAEAMLRRIERERRMPVPVFQASSSIFRGGVAPTVYPLSDAA